MSGSDSARPTIDDFVVITGFSGAGKSQAMACFEDAGYFCVDNLPPRLLSSLADLFQHPGSRVKRAAVVCDVRGGEYFEGIVKVLDELESQGVSYRLLFLEASQEVLIDRYKETRRRHPLAPGGQVSVGVEAEQGLLEPLKQRADLVVDTTYLSAAHLRNLVSDKMLQPSSRGKLGVTFLTFGFKHGAPREVDLSFDVRFLPNPHYEPDLRERTGLDQPVIEFVENSDGISEFYSRLVPLLDYLLPAYVREGKAHLTIGIGCTGGRHRSVVIAQHLAAIYGRRDDCLIEVVHRDIATTP